MNRNHSSFTICHLCSGLAGLIILFLTSPGLLQAQSPSSSGAAKTIIILDASGSMWGQIHGQPKIEIARDTIGKLLDTLPPELELGLMAYGHRVKGDCSDIELLIPPGKVDRAEFMDRVMSIIPVGKTPLTDAVERAANFLKYEENPANVILVSDGLETCDRDPCALGDQLAARGISFRTHIIAFDLSSVEANSIRCLSDKTGGQFLQARDAHTLHDALTLAFEVIAKADKMPEEKPVPASLKAPSEVPAGSLFPVEWTGADHIGDYLTVVPEKAVDGEFGNFEYTKNGSPLELTAPIEAGRCEVRYMTGKGEVMGRIDILVTPVSATVKAPATAVAGSYVEVEWNGPNNKGDRIVILSAGASHGVYDSRAFTSDGNPVKVRATSDVGKTEIHYISGQNDTVLGKTAIEILKANITINSPEVVDAGSEVEISYTGPGQQSDKIVLTVSNPEKGKYEEYSIVSGKPEGTVTLTAPEESGDFYEIRYVEGQDDKTLFGVPLVVRPVNAWVKGPEVALAGSDIDVEWGGPSYSKVVVTIVEKGAAEGTYGDDFSTSNSNSPGNLTVMDKPGEAEVRFVSANGKTLARTSVVIVDADIAITAADTAVAGSAIEVKWTGLSNDHDRITIANSDSAASDALSRVYTERDQSVEIKTPDTPGEYEIRYVTRKQGEIFARKKITVISE